MSETIKVYTGTSIAKDGRTYTMMFLSPSQMPESWLQQRVKGTGRKAVLPEGMELVWSLTHDAFRVFNHNLKVALVDFNAEADTIDLIGVTHRQQILMSMEMMQVYRPDLFEASLAGQSA